MARNVLPTLVDLKELPMTDAERRSVEDFYAHRALVLKRIQRALEKEHDKRRK